jgi:hypothetical protein
MQQRFINLIPISNLTAGLGKKEKASYGLEEVNYGY